jgi:hypothetical protein
MYALFSLNFNRSFLLVLVHEFAGKSDKKLFKRVVAKLSNMSINRMKEIALAVFNSFLQIKMIIMITGGPSLTQIFQTVPKSPSNIKSLFL